MSNKLFLSITDYMHCSCNGSKCQLLSSEIFLIKFQTPETRF